MVVVGSGGSSKSRGVYAILGPFSRHCIKFVAKVLATLVKLSTKADMIPNTPKI